MACPTCDHTVQRVGDLQCWWCPRCGTLITGEQGPDAIEIGEYPALVGRCREFEQDMIHGRQHGGRVGIADWHRLGIAESINVPNDRPRAQ